MKRILTIILLASSALQICRAQEILSERVYLATDRNVYVAGDDMFVSAFCLNTASGKYSDASRTAYLEIIASDGPVQTGRIALQKGRGAGAISLQNTIPTGNYKLVAYTAQCFNEEGYDFEEGARTISIINPFTTDRSASGVDILDAETYAALESGEIPSEGSVKAEMGDNRLVLTNMSSVPVSLSVSISNNDGIVSPDSTNAVTFRRSATCGTVFKETRGIDYEGEIIRTNVSGKGDLKAVSGKQAFLCIPGRVSDLYMAEISQDGEAVFYTRNIYGNEEAFLEIVNPETDCHLVIDPPFKGVKATGLKPLPLSRSLEPRILERSMAMQVQKAAGADSLYERLEIPIDPFLDSDCVEYKLDDYTRFPLMEELFIEFISEIKIIRNQNSRMVTVFVPDSYKPASISSSPALCLVDGVPVMDHSKIFNYDPLLVEKVVIYPHFYTIGSWSYSGIVNFITYKRNMPSLPIESSARVVDFQGASFPVASYLPNGGEDHPDSRQTILWHPLVNIGPGESRILNFRRPSYEVRFDLKVEGFDENGDPQFLEIKE